MSVRNDSISSSVGQPGSRGSSPAEKQGERLGDLTEQQLQALAKSFARPCSPESPSLQNRAEALAQERIHIRAKMRLEEVNQLSRSGCGYSLTINWDAALQTLAEFQPKGTLFDMAEFLSFHVRQIVYKASNGTALNFPVDSRNQKGALLSWLLEQDRFSKIKEGLLILSRG